MYLITRLIQTLPAIALALLLALVYGYLTG